jgi:UDPglucose 6-dehydrogenase
MNEIAVIGAGYVGLTTGAVLAHLGHHVRCADVDRDKVEKLQRGEIPIVEAGLEELVREGLDGGRLSFVLGAAQAVPGAEFVFLCVPTPQADDGSADLSYIRSVAEEIGPLLDPEAVVINKSTVPVGSTREVEQHLGRDDVVVVSNPEFLREGSAVHDCLHPDRIVIGSDDQAAAIRVGALLEGVQAPLIVTAPASAETIKYASNAFLATKVSFINAVANLCEAVGADVREVVLGMGYDKRIGFEFLKPGPGWGGSCLPGEETVLVRRDLDAKLMRLDALFAEVDRVGADGWEVYSWVDGEPTPLWFPVSRFTARRFDGDLVELRTKMGRRIAATPDHPFVVGDGVRPSTAVKMASELTDQDWLPIAQGYPLEVRDYARVGCPLESLPETGLARHKVILRLSPPQQALAADSSLPGPRRSEIRRAGTLRLAELDQIGVDAAGASAGTATNGTYVPVEVPLDIHFWRMIGLYLAEGWITTDGDRSRIHWAFHPTRESELVDAVSSFWRRLGTKVTERLGTTAFNVSISSRILAAWFEHGLGLGRDCYTKRIPDLIWQLPDTYKQALLSGLWDGDGSWSRVGGGPSVVLEYGTTSRQLADGMLRLLGDLGVTARMKVGRTPKSTVDTYWLCISGADQLDDVLWLLPEDEQVTILSSTARQRKRIKPTGYRRLSKNASWVRIDHAGRRPYEGLVYSLEVPEAHTFVTSNGLVTHNCFPKDTRALVRIAEDAGYEFSLLKGVIDVNDEQFEKVVQKIERMAGGSLDGATVAVWGLTFKARTGDLRSSPSLEIVARLHQRGAQIKGFDPTVSEEMPGIEICADPYAACEGAQVLALLTEWDEFRWLDFDKVRDAMAAPCIVDARNLLDLAAMRRRGFTYEGIGRL